MSAQSNFRRLYAHDRDQLLNLHAQHQPPAARPADTLYWLLRHFGFQVLKGILAQLRQNKYKTGDADKLALNQSSFGPIPKGSVVEAAVEFAKKQPRR